MGAIWTDENRFQKWLDVEIAVCEVHADMGTIPRDAVDKIKRTASFSVQRINEIERTTRHDVIAFTTALAENIGPEVVAHFDQPETAASGRTLEHEEIDDQTADEGRQGQEAQPARNGRQDELVKGHLTLKAKSPSVR